MKEFGQHLTIDASQCNRKKLTDQSFVYDILNKLPGKVGMTKMTLPYVVKWLDPGATVEGISGFVTIAESHISIHTFPEKDYVFMDVFSCRNFDVNKAFELLTKVFEAKKFTKKVVKRGIDFPRSHPEHIYLKA
jgi:S-adenosylmethionine decarboxylase